MGIRCRVKLQSKQKSEGMVVMQWSESALLLQDMDDFPRVMLRWILVFYQKNPEVKYRSSVCDPQLKHRWIMQQEMIPSTQQVYLCVLQEEKLNWSFI